MGSMQKVRVGQSRAALVLGLGSLFLWFTIMVPLLAIIVGGLAIKAQDDAYQPGNWMAVTGVVLGVFGLLLVLIGMFII